VGIDDPRAQEAAARCDLLVVATDNEYSRLLTQRLALQYVRPLISLGSHIEVREGADAPRLACRVTVPPLTGGWCLLCADVVDAQQAAHESASPQLRRMLAEAGYMKTVVAPAVYWINSICARLGISIVHPVVAGFADLEVGTDWVFDLGRHRWFEIEHELDDTCYYCSPEGLYASA
jgi:hypothetical protein